MTCTLSPETVLLRVSDLSLPFVTSFVCSIAVEPIDLVCSVAHDTPSPTTSRMKENAGPKRDAARPGPHRCEWTCGGVAEWDVPPACGSTTERRSEKNAACPGFRNLRERPRRREVTSLLISGRPARVKAAIRPTLSHAADVRNLSKRRTHFNQSIPRFERVSEERCSTPRPTHTSGVRSSFVEHHLESRARSVRWLRVRDRPSSFLGTKHWKKPEIDSIIPRTYERMEGFRQGNSPD